MKWETVRNKIIRYTQVYLILGFPVVMATIIASMIGFRVDPIINPAGFSLKHFAGVILEYNMLFWLATLILFLISLILSPTTREKTLCALANIKERDEREQYITGKAARFAYITNLSLLIFLLFFSVFSFHVSYSPQNRIGEKVNMQLRLGVNLLENKYEPIPADNNKNPGKIIWDSLDYSLSRTGVLFVLLAWQLIAFNLAARKEKIR